MPPNVTTARGLLTVSRPFGPAVDRGELIFTADPPAELVPVLEVLHTGVRAVLAGKRWYGCDGETGRVRELNPAAPIPEGVTLLCSEGDSVWDRIGTATRLDLPSLFR